MRYKNGKLPSVQMICSKKTLGALSSSLAGNSKTIQTAEYGLGYRFCVLFLTRLEYTGASQ